MGEAEKSLKLLTHVLYVFEKCWHSSFTPHKNECELSYTDNNEARPFFFGLFRYISYLGQTGCTRSALEMVKLVYRMDLTDPLHLRIQLDYFALRSGNYKWFFNLCETYRSDRRFFLPNIFYSDALAAYLLVTGARSSSPTPSNASTESSGSSSSQSLDTATTLLGRSIFCFPSVIFEINKTIQSSVLSSLCDTHPLLSLDPSQKPLPRLLQTIISIYATLCADFWKPPQVQEWLVSSVEHFCRKTEQEPDCAEQKLGKEVRREIVRIYDENEDCPQVLNEKSMRVSDIIESNEHIPLTDLEGGVDIIPIDLTLEDVIVEGLNFDLNNVTNGIQGSPFWLFFRSFLPWNSDDLSHDGGHDEDLPNS